MPLNGLTVSTLSLSVKLSQHSHESVTNDLSLTPGGHILSCWLQLSGTMMPTNCCFAYKNPLLFWLFCHRLYWFSFYPSRSFIFFIVSSSSSSWNVNNAVFCTRHTSLCSHHLLIFLSSERQTHTPTACSTHPLGSMYSSHTGKLQAPARSANVPPAICFRSIYSCSLCPGHTSILYTCLQILRSSLLLLDLFQLHPFSILWSWYYKDVYWHDCSPTQNIAAWTVFITVFKLPVR